VALRHRKSKPPRPLRPSDSQDILQSLHTIDESINVFNLKLQPPALAGKVFGIPYPRNRLFTGRESTMSEIEDLLVHQASPMHRKQDNERTSSVRIFVIHGLPGIGKTHLAVEFGYRQKDIFSYVFWVSADSEEKLDQGLVNIARSLGLASDTMIEEKGKMIGAAMGWLKSESIGESLLIKGRASHALTTEGKSQTGF
jgi:hypothetical protein